MGKLEGRAAIVTGAALGIGAATAGLFRAEGARLMLGDLRTDELAALARSLGGETGCETVDVSVEEDVRRLVDRTMARFGRIDVAVLNAGISGPPGALVDYATDDFDRVMAVNVRSVWVGLKHTMQAMAGTGGSIVVTASTSGLRAISNRAPYVASKHAVVGLVKAAALEGAPRGIRVNAIAPATIDTPMVRALRGPQDGAGAPGGSLESSIPLGRRGEADEVARMMLFLASADSSFCTGGVYLVDGGATAGKFP